MDRSSFLSERAARRVPVASLLLVGFAVAVHFVPGAAEWLQFDRQAIAGGQVWRLATSHFAHWSGNHLCWDALALAMLGGLCERDRARAFLPCIALSTVLIPLTLWFALPQMTIYRGLSGIDSALFALLAVRLVGQSFCERDWLKLTIAGVVSVGFAAKIGYEFLSGATLFVDSAAAAMTPVPLAHMVGGFVGLGCGVRDLQRTFGEGSLAPRCAVQYSINARCRVD